jgi:O-methyltransferase
MLSLIKNFITKKLATQNIFLTSSLTYLQRNRKINTSYLDYVRQATLELVAHEINTKQLKGSVAELGVYKGQFAQYINQYFNDRKFYLFDTFEGFDDRDKTTELQQNFSVANQDFSNTSVAAVLAKMSNANNCIVRKGYFPETANGITDNFVFVSIDTDLYKPIYDGLHFFYPLLVSGGFIFIHDYNNDGYKGAKEAVQLYCKEHNIAYLPIADSGGTVVIAKP